MKVALVYDRVNKWGGAERVLLALHEIFKEAPLYTSVFCQESAPWASVFNIKTSFLQKIPHAKLSHEKLALLMPFAFESFNFDNYDIVISITSEAAKGIITKKSTLHICLCLTPTRYLWSGYNDYFSNIAFRHLARPLVAYLRTWDKIAATRPDYYIAISETVRNRIKKYYDREAEIIYPPVGIENSQLKEIASARWPSGLAMTKRCVDSDSDYFLIVSRLVPYKRIDLAIKAFNQLGWNLKIVGTGREFRKLKSIAGKNIQFLGYLTDKELSVYYKNAQALIFPGIEDFGLVMAEAGSFGVPVICYRGGAACEIVHEGISGDFFESQDLQSIINVLEKFDKRRYNKERCIKNIKRFSFDNFEKKFRSFVEGKVKEYFK